MQNFHIIRVKYLPWTDTKPSRIRIRSDRFQQSVIVSTNQYETGVQWLKEHKFNIVGTDQNGSEVLIVSTTFKPLKPY